MSIIQKKFFATGQKFTVIFSTNLNNRFLNKELVVTKQLSTLIQFAFASSPEKSIRKDYEPAARVKLNERGELEQYDVLIRPLTIEEKEILANMPSHLPENQEQCVLDAITDGSMMYFADKHYLAKSGYSYLTYHNDNGKYLKTVEGVTMLVDPSLPSLEPMTIYKKL